MRNMAVVTEMTFNDLTSLSRIEKANSALSTVRRDLYPAMRELYDRQCKECERLASADTGSLLFDGASEKKRKIYNLMKDITMTRMNKIMAMAMRGSMGANNILENLTPEEKEYYEEIYNASKRHWTLLERRKAATMDIVTGDMNEPVTEEMPVKGTVVENVVPENTAVPEIEVPEPVSEPPAPVPMEEIDEFPEDAEEIADVIAEEMALGEAPSEIPGSETRVEDVPAEPEMPVREPAVEEKAEIPALDDDLKVIRILEDLQPFSGLNDIIYNLRKEDIVRLPSMFANALINRGVAASVNITL